MICRTLLLALLFAGAFTARSAPYHGAADSAELPPEKPANELPPEIDPSRAPAEPPGGVPDLGKLMVEAPVKKALAPSKPRFRQARRYERVKPGLVNWYRSTAAATAAARKSGKPVLVFQLFGRLDDRFC